MNFNNINLSPWIITALTHAHINELTKIQEQALPIVLKKQSVIITSQTGTGKTLCYLLPLLNSLNFHESNIQAIILLPTKELARQVAGKLYEFKSFNTQLRVSLVIGNEDFNRQIQSIKTSHPQVVVGTVTRVLDLIKNKTINRDVNLLVLDEVDMLLDMGFHKQVNEIFEFLNKTTLQKITCSATTHYSLAQHLRKYLGNTKVIGVNQTIWSNQSITHNLVYSDGQRQQIDVLFGLLKNINPYFCIIFANTKNIANDLYKEMLNRTYNVALLHKDLTTRQRKNIYRDLNQHRFQYLVATDLAARGLDINGVDIVISYGLPEDDIWYMHRIGRTGRIGQKGIAYTIYESGIDNRIVRLNKKHIEWNYLYLNKDQELIPKPLQLRFKPKLRLDDATNQQIKMLIGTNSKRVRPGYKKKIKQQIYKIKQKKRHEFIEHKIKQTLISKNIRESMQKHRNR